MTEKNLVAYRLSDQALEHLDKVSKITGTNKTAIVEMALAKLSIELTGKTKMGTLQNLLTKTFGDIKLTYVGTIYGSETGETMTGARWLDAIVTMFGRDSIADPVIDHPSTSGEREGWYIQSGDIWYIGRGTQERVFITSSIL